MGEVIIVTQTVITNTYFVDAETVEGMSDEAIQELLIEDPEYFGQSADPDIDPDTVISIEREGWNGTG